MTHKTGAFAGLNAILMDTQLDVALGAVIHLHPVPGVLLESGDVLAPDIPAVSCDSVFLVDLQGAGITDVAVAGFAVHFGRFDMGCMGKEDAVGLPGVDKPGDLDARRHVVVDKDGFIFGIPLNTLMAVDALGELRDAGIAAVFPEEMAAFTPFVHQLVVQLVVEIERLAFLGVKKFRKNDPPYNQARDKSDNKKKKRKTAPVGNRF
jgi:hypothetical protein